MKILICAGHTLKGTGTGHKQGGEETESHPKKLRHRAIRFTFIMNKHNLRSVQLALELILIEIIPGRVLYLCLHTD